VRNDFVAAAWAPDVAWRRRVSALAESDADEKRTVTTAAAMIVFVDMALPLRFEFDGHNDEH
jgi:hypothetical protein